MPLLIAASLGKIEVRPGDVGMLWNSPASLGMVAFLIPATIFGFAKIGVAVALHEGSTLLVVANALRLLAYEHRRGTI